jgi:MYXO-CTERM domain-containing protein
MTSGHSSGGCGCRVGGAGERWAGPWALALLAGLCFSRRRAAARALLVAGSSALAASCGSSSGTQAGSDASTAGGCGSGEVYCSACAGGGFCSASCPAVTCPAQLDAGLGTVVAANGNGGTCPGHASTSCQDCSGGAFCVSGPCPLTTCPVGDSGTRGGSEGGTVVSASCPATLPTFGTTCPALGLSCTYGGSPRPSCRTIMGCGGAQQCNCGSDTCPPSACTTPQTWIGGGPGSGVGLTDRCTWTCPATPPSAGQPCTPPGYCAEADGSQCGCIGFDSTGASVWTCLPPPSDPRCPKVAPLIGSACTDEGLACGNYDICVTGSRVLCKGSTWIDNFGSCPK